MSQAHRDNVDLEVILRNVCGQVVGQFRRGGTSPPRWNSQTDPGSECDGGYPDGESEDDDHFYPDDRSWNSSDVEEYISNLNRQDVFHKETDADIRAQRDEFMAARSSEVPIPARVDEIFDWEISNYSDTRLPKGEWAPPKEPRLALNADGLPPFHKCAHCEHVVVWSAELHSEQRILVARDRGQLDRAAEDGCPLYQWLVWYLYKNQQSAPAHESDVFLKFRCRADDKNALGTISGEFVERGPNPQGEIGKGGFGPFHFMAPECINLGRFGEALDSCIDNPAAKFVRARPVNMAVSSNEAFDAARGWLQECCSTHADCHASGKLDLPFRLLLLDENSIKLYRTSSDASPRPEYIALSYCWGGDQPARTTIENRSQREQSGIDVADLPRSLQDAVTVTRKLGLSYLWIDSLCIVQDDEKDVAREVTKMADIFSGAYVTISAANATSCHQGFLHDRKPSALRQHVIGVPYLCPDGQEGRVYFYRLERHNPHAEEHINTRAWTLQEHLLSPRLLVYGSWQLRWICRKKLASDGGPENVYHETLEKLAAKLQSSKTVSSLHDEGLRACDEGRDADAYRCLLEIKAVSQDLWPTLVREFTGRKLSISSDRARAIFGIAQAYATLSEDHYLAGLWSRNFLRQLLWYVVSSGVSSDGSPPGGRQARGRPSWSWISVHDNVDWDIIDSDLEPSLDIMACDTSGFGPLGATKDVPLTVRGRIREAYYLRTRPNVISFYFDRDMSKGHRHAESASQDSQTLERRQDLALTANGIFDRPDEHSGPGGISQVFCLQVLPCGGEDRSGPRADEVPVGLLLEQCPEGFRRVGYFNFAWANSLWLSLYESGSRDHDERRAAIQKEIFAQCPMEVVTIV